MTQADNGQLMIEAYSLIKYLYRTMPEYNKLKGTYAGIQTVLNLMGLCASITEIWSDRTTQSLENFASGNEGLYRSDIINCVKYRIADWGSAKINDCFLTSRFDLDINQNSTMTFGEFSKMADTVILVTLQMAPVTRALRRLYYIIKFETDIHIDYVFDTNIRSNDNTDIINRMHTFRYRWNVINNYFYYKSEFDFYNCNIYKIFLPWSTVKAALVNVRDVHRDGSYTDLLGNEIDTMKNCYFNLFKLDKKLKAANQNMFRFNLIARENDSTHSICKEYSLEIGKHIDITTERNGITLRLLNEATSIFSDIFGYNLISELESAQLTSEQGDDDLISEDSIAFDDNVTDPSQLGASIWLTAAFTMPLGAKYIYMDNSIPLRFNNDDLVQ